MFEGTVTAKEISAQTGKSESRTRELIKVELAAGRIRQVEGTRPARYEPLPTEAKKPKRKGNLNPQQALTKMYAQAAEAGTELAYDRATRGWTVAGQTLTSKELAGVRASGFPEWLAQHGKDE